MDPDCRRNFGTFRDAIQQADVRIANLQAQLAQQDQTIGDLTRRLAELEQRITMATVASRGTGPTEG